MKVIRSIKEMRSWRKALGGKTIGFVPTMGALHSGHEALLKKARSQHDELVLSIFVNPTQFNDPKDFEKYPSTWEADLALASKNRVDVVFAPAYGELYSDNYRFKISENDYSKALCGKDRPGHFDGVLTVVMKLFQIVKPEKAYFGEKDYQQLQLVKDLVDAFFLDLKIVAVPTVREKDGLAKSSRNVRLRSADREIAPLLHQTIIRAATADEANKKLREAGFQVDYVTDLNGRRFVAARLGEVRLIDNVEL